MDRVKKQEIYTHEQLRGIVVSLIRKYNATSALLFGSYARDIATKDSDIDLVIIGGKNFIPADIFAIAEDLHTITGKPVDVYEISELKKDMPFYKAVMEEGVAIQPSEQTAAC